MDPTELLKKVRRIQIRTAHRVSEALAGQYHSAFRGQGIEFEEVRPYQIGDDVRQIDWNVSARMGEPFVKLFREERELTVMLAIDLSRSQDFGTRGGLKRDLVAELAATIAISAVRNGDKVGLMLFTHRVECVVPPRKGPRHVLRIVREVLAFEPSPAPRDQPGTDLETALDELSRVLRKRSVVFVVSDFLVRGLVPDALPETSTERPSRPDDAAPRSRPGSPRGTARDAIPGEHALRVLRRRHDLVPVVVSDHREAELPAVGLLEMIDRETGRTAIIDTSSAYSGPCASRRSRSRRARISSRS
jgi:uncharacterized protein (DUF58 family)